MDLAMMDETKHVSSQQQAAIQKLLEYAAGVLELPENTEMSLTFVDNQRIQEINRDYRHKDQVTDVISFAIEDEVEDESFAIPDEWDIPRNIGDIFISINRAKEQAESYGHSYERELGFLAVHGFLHLNGYDHMEPEEEKEMFTLQRKILDDYGLVR